MTYQKLLFDKLEKNESSAPEKGLAFERKLYGLFKKEDYDVQHDVKKKGRSGATHQIDILADYHCPLHTSRVIIEAKSYEKKVNKDIIMKLIQIVDDLGADRGILATTSDFTPGAIATAEEHGIDIWNRERLIRELGELELAGAEEGLPKEIVVTELVVKPKITEKDARKTVEDILEDRASGGFLGMGKVIEELERMKLLYYPYYTIKIELPMVEERKTGLFNKETVEKRITKDISVDATTGDLVTQKEEGIDYPYTYLTTLDREEVKFFRTLCQRKDPTSLGYSDYKRRKIANSLIGKGVIERERKGRQTTLNLKVPFPSDPQKLRPIQSKERKKIEAKTPISILDSSAIIKALESYWEGSSVKYINIVYYPYFAYLLKTEDGGKRVEVIDGVKGTLNKPFSDRVSILTQVFES